MEDSPRLWASNQRGTSSAGAEADHSNLLEQAINHCLTVRWIYNRTTMQAQPQVLYRRKNGVYLDAIVTERAGKALEEAKLGSFKLTGLTSLMIVNEAFTPMRGIDPGDVRYEEGIIARAAG